MVRGGWFRAFSVFITAVLLMPLASAHEQEIFNVILIEDDVRPGNITDVTFVEGNGIVFRMRDTMENTSMQVRIDLDQDGLFEGEGDNISSWLTRSCELDENGSLVDESCAVSHSIVFGNTSQGTYGYQVERMVNNSTTDVWDYSIIVHADIHEEPGQPTVGDCFGAGCDEESDVSDEVQQTSDSIESKLSAVMAMASLGIFMMVLSIRKERRIKNSDRPSAFQESE
ncbi:MAG: hypothetical protein GWP25_07510 [Euryarchaeota archaeon]|nr:hypothetical protein [Euryarchaeota archaeon]